MSEIEKQLILERLDMLSPDLVFSVGFDNKTYSKNDLKIEVEQGTEIGRDYAKTELEFLRSLKDGSLMEILRS